MGKSIKAKVGPSWPQVGSKLAPSWLQLAPRWPKIPKMEPSWLQVGSKCPKLAQVGPKLAQVGPMLAQLGFFLKLTFTVKTHGFGHILGQKGFPKLVSS